ncbi:hypothetical protein J6590_014660 [Homalodisca vitripennis]|nr:hypothetical protein J6590_014660 [Homalodisca vitripennis]
MTGPASVVDVWNWPVRPYCKLSEFTGVSLDDGLLLPWICGTGQLDLIAKLSVFTGGSLDDWSCFCRGCVELARMCGTGQLDLIAKLSVFTGGSLDDWACFSRG